MIIISRSPNKVLTSLRPLAGFAPREPGVRPSPPSVPTGERLLWILGEAAGHRRTGQQLYPTASCLPVSCQQGPSRTWCVQVLARQVMEEVLSWLQSQLQSKVKGKKTERIRQWQAVSFTNKPSVLCVISHCLKPRLSPWVAITHFWRALTRWCQEQFKK